MSHPRLLGPIARRPSSSSRTTTSSRTALARLLDHEGYSVTTAGTGQEALETLSQTRPDLVLLDLVLPGMDGYEVLRRIRQDPLLASLKVIVLSGDLMNVNMAELRALEVDRLLAKPVDFDDVQSLLSRAAPLASTRGE